MIKEALTEVIQQWARGDQAGALAVSAALLARHDDEEQVVLTHSGLQLHRQDFDGAAETIQQFMGRHTPSPALLANLSIALRGQGHFEQAAAVAKDIIEQAPQLVSGWNALALAQTELKDHEAAEATLRAALDQHPNHPALKHHLNQTLESLNKNEEGRRISPTGDLLSFANSFSKESNPVATEALLRKAVYFTPQRADAHLALGLFLLRFERFKEAQEALDMAHDLNPNCPTTRYFLSLTRGDNPAVPDPGYAERLFDSYASSFDQSLVEQLNYHVPEQLVDLLRSEVGQQPLQRALDLGCGTGLVGKYLSAHVPTIDGVDLSTRMIDKARERGVYASLHKSEIRDFLSGSSDNWDVILAADVFIYCGDVGDIIQACAKRLNPGGWLAFSVEAPPSEDTTLRYEANPVTGRYLHSRSYLEQALQADFTPPSFIPAVLRMNAGQPVNGWLVLAQKSR